MKDPQELIQRFKSRVHVLDGGLATELEKRGHDISGKLWSAQVLLDDPGAIEQLHYDYLKAGADIIITSSYQLTFQGMKEAGYSHEQAEDALWKSVEVAAKARDRYLSELKEDLPEDRKPLIAASIGPYGAYLANGSEYSGSYGLKVDERCALLKEFHRDRYQLLAGSQADLIAFETIPLFDEAYAYAALLLDHPTPAWFTFTAPQREFPAFHRIADAHNALQASMALDGMSESSEIRFSPVALGLNCLPPDELVYALTCWKRLGVPLVVYPNSGEGWDAEHRCWVGENDAAHFAEYAREWIRAGANIIGGCCRTGPEHIAQLRALVDSLA